MAKDLESRIKEELRSWCRGEGLDETQALMASVPEVVENSEVEATLETIKVLGRMRVKGKKYNDKLARLTVLCEIREAVKQETAPPEVVPADGKAWPIIIIGPAQAATEDFIVRLKGLQQAKQWSTFNPCFPVHYHLLAPPNPSCSCRRLVRQGHKTC